MEFTDTRDMIRALEKLEQLALGMLLTQREVDDENPAGEDGNQYAFERGQAHGCHDMAVDILEALGVEVVLEQDDEDEDE